MACDFISENPVEAAKLCYENGYVADEDYEFNGKLLESYRYKFNYEDAKASFVDVTKDLNESLRLINQQMNLQMRLL